jgi:hypothetical protein
VNAQDGPLRTWVGGWVDLLHVTVPRTLVVVVAGAGIWMSIGKGDRTRRVPGGVRAAILFGIGAALVYLFLTNVDTMADHLGDELPLGGR